MSGKISEEAMQEQAERAEYVKNIGIEYRFGCYEVRNLNFQSFFEVKFSGKKARILSIARRIHGSSATKFSSGRSDFQEEL